ncbi:MAG: DUF1800 domain-containing protein [Pyrinomonadaceae bacterium]|nr:DUF1800 domain-containing protein [Pyrinomonadaceae bacterium]
MISRKTRLFSHILGAVILSLLTFIPAFAQDDPNPNSPTPIVISEPDSLRVLTAASSVKSGKRAGLTQTVFREGSYVTIFVTNLSLLENEGVNAFRILVEDQQQRLYRFPVVKLEQLKGQEWIYALTFEVRDNLGFWQGPLEIGDAYLRLTWRGLVSNPVKIALGRSGGNLKEIAGAQPTPMKMFADKPGDDSSTTSNYVGYTYSGDRIRFLEQATFGPTAALDHRLRRIGLRVWLAEQFDMPYPSVENPYPDLPLRSNDTNNATLGCGMFASGSTERRICLRDYYSQYLVQSWFFKEAFYGDAQLRHRVAWALGQLWVVSGVDTQQASHVVAYHQILSRHAFGNYRDLMKDVTLNPAMGNYLDMARSTRTNPNENFAREILQLFSVGLFMMNQDGTLQLDQNNNPIPTYNQTTVNNFTKVFTGWSFCNTGTNPLCPSAVAGTVNYKDPLLLNQANHDVTAKTLLSYPNAVNPTIAANLNGNTEIDLALDNIFYHPNVGPFVSRNLIQHLVTSDPTPAYVGRIAAVFNNNGLGVRGDLKAVVKAILLDPEARGDVKTDPHYGKLREPVLFTTNFLRHFNVGSANLTMQSDGVVSTLPNAMGQNPFYSPTVFNYYTPDYVIPGTGLNGPEFGLMTTGTAIARANVANTMTFSRLNTSADAPAGTSINLAEMTALVQSDPTGNQLLDVLNTRMLHGTMSQSMRNTILTSIAAVSAATPQARAQQAIYLIVTSSQYQVQR